MVVYKHQTFDRSLYKRPFLGHLGNKNAVSSDACAVRFIRVLCASNLGRDPPLCPPPPLARIGGVTPKYFPIFH
mgnify:CR=1 FL=1